MCIRDRLYFNAQDGTALKKMQKGVDKLASVASLSTPFCIFFNAVPSCALKYNCFAAAVTESGARAWRVVRRTLAAIGLPTSFNTHRAHPSSVTTLSRVTRPVSRGVLLLYPHTRRISPLPEPHHHRDVTRASPRARPARRHCACIAFVSITLRASRRVRVSRARRHTHRRSRASWRRRSWRWRCARFANARARRQSVVLVARESTRGN